MPVSRQARSEALRALLETVEAEQKRHSHSEAAQSWGRLAGLLAMALVVWFVSAFFKLQGNDILGGAVLFAALYGAIEGSSRRSEAKRWAARKSDLVETLRHFGFDVEYSAQSFMEMPRLQVWALDARGRRGEAIDPHGPGGLLG